MYYTDLPGPIARLIIERDKKVISQSYPRVYPFVMDYGRGVEVWDVDGNRFLDFAAGIAVLATGHSHPKVVMSVQEQAERFFHISSDFYHEKWVELGEAIDKISPFNEKTISFMSNSGAESIEAAIKLARYHTGRTQFIGFHGAFHGRTMGALAFTASKKVYKHGYFPLMNGVVHVPYPDPYHPILTSLPGENYGKTIIRYIEEQILERLLPPEDVAGILVEPIQGEGGYVVPAPGFFPALRELCDRYGILLIADEIQSGMGRTGKWWAIEHFDAKPDIICVAKGIASGLPLGVTFAREEIMSWPKGAHGNTYGGNPIACAAALTTIDLIGNEYLNNAREVGAYAKTCAQELLEKYQCIGDVRGEGLMIGIEFVKDQEMKIPAEVLSEQIIKHAFSMGLLLLGCGKSTIRIAPPLCVTREEINEGYYILDEAIKTSESELNAVVT
jgi:4-aminobutyrate aminotransferase